MKKKKKTGLEAFLPLPLQLTFPLFLCFLLLRLFSERGELFPALSTAQGKEVGSNPY